MWLTGCNEFSSESVKKTISWLLHGKDGENTARKPLAATGGIASKVNAFNFWAELPNTTTYKGINAFVTLKPEEINGGGHVHAAATAGPAVDARVDAANGGKDAGVAAIGTTPMVGGGSAGSYTFELQFHTTESLALKMGRSHVLYEEIRSPKQPATAKLAFYRELKQAWNTVPLPVGIMAVSPAHAEPVMTVSELCERIPQRFYYLLGICLLQLVPCRRGHHAAFKTARWKHCWCSIRRRGGT